MFEREDHGDVVRVRFWSRLGAAVGYDASVYVTRGVLVDTAFRHVSREVATLVDEVRPSAAFVTHWHEDHAGNVPLLAARGVALVMSAATEEILRTRPPIRMYRRLVWGQTPVLGRSALGATWAGGAAGERAAAGLELLAAPGHSPDHHVVWDAERGTLFSGDLFLGVKVRVAHAAERPRELLASLRRIAALQPERMFDTHRGAVPDPVQALLAKAEWMEETIGAIEALIGRGWSDAAIRSELFGRESMDGWLSGLEYARLNLVRGVRRG